MIANTQQHKHVDGVLNIAKPTGATSMDVVRTIKKLTKQKKLGHGGTLDPLATGVLPIFLGKATRLMEYLVDSTKIYHTQIRLGMTTDTYDIDGTVTATRDFSSVTQEMVEKTLELFKGTSEQVPPMYSALKHEGKRLYKLARDGHEIERPSRQVQIDSIVLTAWNPPLLDIQVQCGKGMYVRSLSHDIGELLHCGATVVSLSRLQSGPFHLNKSISLEAIHEHINAGGSWTDYVSPADLLVQHLPQTAINEGRENLILQGRPVSLEHEDLDTDQLLRIYGPSGNFLALAKYDQALRLWQPTKVLDLTAEVAANPEHHRT